MKTYVTALSKTEAWLLHTLPAASSPSEEDQ